MIIHYDPRTRLGSPQPFVSINKRGLLLSATVVEQNSLGNFRYALLSFDPKEKLVVITLAKKASDRAVAVRKPEKASGTLFINARGFFTFMGLALDDLLGRYEPIVKASGDSATMSLNLAKRQAAAAPKSSKKLVKTAL